MNNKRMIRQFLTIDLIFLIVCCFGLYFISQKASLPVNIIYNENEVRIFDSKNSSIPDGSLLVSINNILISSNESIEFILDGHKVDDIIELRYLYNEEFDETEVKLTTFYGIIYIIIAAITGLTYFLLGILVLIKSGVTRFGVIFHWLSLSVAGIIMMSWGRYDSTFLEIGYLTRVTFHLCYLVAPTMFLHFAFAFPKNRFTKNVFLIQSAYIFVALLTVIINVFFVAAALDQSQATIDAYIKSFGILRVFTIICVLFSVTVFISSYFLAKVESERNKLKWILVGFFSGPVVYILFWVIPQLLNMGEPLPEELIVLLSNSVPITFAIAIIKYHLFDIDYILNRTLVYGVVIAIMISIYVSIILLLVNSFSITDNIYISTFSITVIALLSMPVKQKVQNFVDTKFFRVKYNFRKAVNNVYNALKEFNDIKSLADYLVSEIYKLIPVEKVGVFEVNDNREYVRLIAHKKLTEFRRNQYRLKYSRLVGLKPEIITRVDKVEKGAMDSTSFNKFLQRYNLVLIVPLISESDKYFGWIAIGSKLSGQRFTLEDIDLIKNISVVAAATLNRIALQEQLITERLLAAELEELNKQKSLYVSSVSHELKSPLTSIKLFAELILRDKELNPDKVKNHLNIIENETDRLSRLISNILDVSKIEKGTKIYQPKKIYINKPVEELLSVIGLRIRSEGFSLITDLGKLTDKIMADEEAVKQAIENLINNSMRYSSTNKFVYIQTFCYNGFACIKVEDKGIGISESALQKICEPFYRESDDNNGLGLGLFIIKHIMDSHNGQIEINSARGIGTTVILKFPLIK